jgi:hypothetical protein
VAQVKKLSVATVHGKINLEKLIEANKRGETMPIMRVVGAAVSVKSGVSSYGDWNALSGTFQATDAETGEISEASMMFLPDVALTPILVALSNPACKGVEFAIQIDAKYAENTKAGGVPYEYTFHSLLPTDENDPITRLNQRLLALNGPKGDDKPAAATPAKGKGK